MREIKIFAPTSGKVYPIKNLNDGVFSEGMLGDGVYLVPDDNNFSSILENGKIKSIFETKHAIYFEDNSVFILMHVGLDTVNLNGKPFILNVKEGQRINMSDELMTVDLKSITEHKISTATPIVVDLNESKNVVEIKYHLENGALVKKGDLLFTIFAEDIDKKAALKRELLNYEDIYYKSSQEIFNYVGKKSNYQSVYNCVTRLRFIIKNKELVNIPELKKMSLIKGINWNGDELQIIIGANVQILKDAFDKFYLDFKNGTIKGNNKIQIKRSKKEIIFGGITGIVTPVIPILLIFGMLQGVRALFIQFDWMQGKTSGDGIATWDWIYSSISEVGLTFIFIAFIWSTVKYLNGNVIVAIFIGLALCNPFLLASNNKWVWFTIDMKLLSKPVEIGIINYTTSVIPAIFAGFIYYFIDKWIKTWMPGVVDIVFRHTLAFIFTVVLMLFAFGPISKIIEIGLSIIVISAGKIPFGIGVGLFALLYQPLVLTGMHQVVLNVLRAQLAASDGPLILYTGVIIGTWGQIGAAIGVAFATKRQALRQTANGALPAALLGGVTEPILYGVNLLRVKPFIAGTLAAGVGGTISGILGVGRWGQAPGGIFHILGYTEGGLWNIINYNIVMIITAISALLITIVIYSDRTKEKYLLGVTSKKLRKYLTNINFLNDNVNHQISHFSGSLTNEEYKLFDSYEKFIIKSENLNNKLSNIDEKENKTKKHLANKLKKTKNEQEIDLILEKFDWQKFENLRLEVNNEIKINNAHLFEIKEKVESVREKHSKTINDIIDEISVSTKDQQVLKFKNNYYNAFNNLDFIYDLKIKSKDLFIVSKLTNKEATLNA